MAKFGKRTTAAREAFAGKVDVTVEDAVALVKANATAKFDETIEIAVNLGVDPRHADQLVRGVVGLPNGTGKTVRVAVFARGPKADEATAAGADIGGAEDLMETTRRSLWAGIGQMQPGHRLGDVSHAVQGTVETGGYSVVRDFVGHGIGRALHEPPQGPNF